LFFLSHAIHVGKLAIKDMVGYLNPGIGASGALRALLGSFGDGDEGQQHDEAGEEG
jgi:hypothetical protein